MGKAVGKITLVFVNESKKWLLRISDIFVGSITTELSESLRELMDVVVGLFLRLNLRTTRSLAAHYIPAIYVLRFSNPASACHSSMC